MMTTINANSSTTPRLVGDVFTRRRKVATQKQYRFVSTSEKDTQGCLIPKTRSWCQDPNHSAKLAPYHVQSHTFTRRTC